MPSVDDYDYPLPEQLIAQQPLAQRSDARLLVVERQSQVIYHQHVRDLPTLLKAGDCLVLNDTRVVPARLVGYRVATQGRWEGLFLRADPSGAWQLLGKTRGKLQPGEMVMLVNHQMQDAVPLRMVFKQPDGIWVARPEENLPPDELLERVGRVPLPHYIRGGEMGVGDRERYQTVFAEHPGSVAAPTAGLHFTPELLRKLHAQGVKLVRVTLHVGIDTFRPMMTKSVELHPMHSEWGEIKTDAVDTIRQSVKQGGRVIAVGTTSVRVLESASQEGYLQPWKGETRLFIHPPYQFKTVGGMMTNFHLPKTTLLVLVRTFGGDALMRRAYEEAIAEQYRFYSYGDAMLIV